eukprot:9466732-Pyramimonas_sp.AAC.1
MRDCFVDFCHTAAGKIARKLTRRRQAVRLCVCRWRFLLAHMDSAVSTVQPPVKRPGIWMNTHQFRNRARLLFWQTATAWYHREKVYGGR